MLYWMLRHWWLCANVHSSLPMSDFKFSRRSHSRMLGVDPELLKVASRAIEISEIDVLIPPHGGYRTASEQKSLFDKGVSRCDGISFKSDHQSGLALDVVAYVDGVASWEKEHCYMVAAAMFQAASELDISIRWGGYFTGFFDGAHFSLS